MKLRVTILAIIGFSFLLTGVSFAQEAFERAETSTGTLRLAITNFGAIGKSDVRNNPDNGASMRFPANSGTEHLFEAGLWVGAFINGGIRVSTASITDPSGFTTGKAGYEFTADRALRFEGEETGIGISQEDIIADYSDKRTVVTTGTSFIPISGHTAPIFADVHVESYNWAFSFTENFTIMRFDITNNSQIHSGDPNGFVWDSVFVGMYADLVVRDVNTTLDQGTAFFNKNGIGYLDSLFTTYAFDAGSNDNPSINTYGALSIIGAEYRNNFFHPFNEEGLLQKGITPPKVGPSYWLFANGTGVFRRPTDDLDRYSRMAEEFPIDGTLPNGDSIREALRTDGQDAGGNYLSFISMGPFSEVQPGETVTVFFVFSAALKPDEFQGLPGKAIDNDDSRVELLQTIQSAIRVFQGEDRNNNGELDDGEDLNENGVLDRFLFPTPPDDPKTRIELEAGKATIYWDKRAEFSRDRVSGEEDFEGYKVYRSDFGQDLNPRLRVIREFDTPGNDVGFNVGFDEVALAEPKIFPDDTTNYWYAFEVDGLLNGWQYVFSVTAFDKGNETFELESLETSPNVNSTRVFPGTSVNQNFRGGDEFSVGVYPNPYRVNAAWDGNNEETRKIYFYNLPQRAQIRVYTLAGEIVAELDHDASTYQGDIAWFNRFSGNPRVLSGGEHAFDLLSEANQRLSTGLYLFTVKDLSSGKVQTGKLALIK